MGYSIYLIDKNKSITEEVMDSVVASLPKRLHGYFYQKQGTFWSLRTDLHLDNKNEYGYLRVSGSFSSSGEWALDMVLALQQLLQREGYIIEIFSVDFGFCNKELYEWLGYDNEELENEESF